MIEFDVETTGLQPWSEATEAFLWIFYDGTTAEAIPFLPSEHERWEKTMELAWADGQRGDAKSVLRFIDHFLNFFRIQWWFNRAKKEGIRAWNAKFDRGFAEAAGCFDLPGDGLWHDGMLIAHAMDERRSVALKAVATQLFGSEAADPQKALKAWLNEENRRRRKVAREKKRQFEPANYSHVPWAIMQPYALEDVILTRRICDVYETRLAQAPDLSRVVEFERRTMDALFAVEKRGLPAVEEEYRKLEQEVVANLERLGDRVHDLANEGDPLVYAKELGVEVTVEETPAGRILHYEGEGGRLEDFNPRSTPQVLAALKARGADLAFMSEKDGKIGADADNLRAVDDALAEAILDYRTEAKVLSTYVRPMIGRSYVSAMNTYKEPFIAEDSRIHATYRQVGARTGRMSCADPNMQNQPRDDLRLRYNIVADPGHVLITCDLSNIEMMVFAAYCGEGRLLDALQRGEDLHVLTAKMLGLRDRQRSGGGIETARQLGKVYNFTSIYGGGLRSIKRYFRCDMAQARLYKRRYEDAYPEVTRLQTRIEYKLSDDGYIQDKIISGRRFRVDLRDSYKATNYLVQGTAASLLKDAVITLHADGVPMVALVHDEIVAHVPVEEAVETAKLIEKRMTQAIEPGGPLWLDETKDEAGNVTRPAGPAVPLAAEAEIVKRWSDAKPLKDKTTGEPYLFTPEWAGGEKRPVPTVEEVLAAA